MKIFSWLLICIFFISGCDWFHTPCHTAYKHTVNIIYSFFIKKDTINVGDTAFISFNATQLLDEYNDNVDLRGAVFQINLYSYMADPSFLVSQKYYKAADSCFFLNIVGAVLPPPSEVDKNIRIIQFKYTNNAYQFKIGIIPLKKGIYFFNMAGLAASFSGKSNCESDNSGLDTYASHSSTVNTNLMDSFQIPYQAPNGLYNAFAFVAN